MFSVLILQFQLVSLLIAHKPYTILSHIGTEDSGDPYGESNSSKFIDGLALWLAVEYGHILGVYFIARPGLHTHKQLLAWKQLYAYNYFPSSIHSVSISLSLTK